MDHIPEKRCKLYSLRDIGFKWAIKATASAYITTDYNKNLGKC